MNASVGLFAQHLIPIRRRLQWRDGLWAAWMTISGGLAFTCLLLIAGRLRPLVFQWQLLLIGLSLTLFAFSLGQLFAWFRPVPLRKLARLGDARLGLDERLITALELAEGRLETSANLKQAQLDDTFNRLNHVPLKNAIPLARRNQQLFAAGTLIVLAATAAALTITPNPQQTVLEERAELVEFLETEIAELEEIQAEMLPEIDATGSEIEPATEALDALIDRLEAARKELSPESALAALSEADQTLQTLDQLRQTQEQAMNQLASSLTHSDLAASQEQTAAQAAAEALEDLAENPPQSAAEAEALAQSLSEAASAVAGSNPALGQALQQAAEALQSGDTQGAQSALAQAAGQLAQSGAQGAATGAQIQQALENIQRARAQLAQQNGQGTAGQGAGQGDGTGQGTGGSGTGGGSGRGDPGAGNDGLFSAQGVNGTISTDNGPNQNRLDDYNSVYAPDHLGGTGGDFVVPDPQGADGSGFDIGETPLNPNRPSGESTVPYTEVYRQYADQAGAALEGEYIPLGMKDYVRQYFGSLEP